MFHFYSALKYLPQLCRKCGDQKRLQTFIIFQDKAILETDYFPRQRNLEINFFPGQRRAGN